MRASAADGEKLRILLIDAPVAGMSAMEGLLSDARMPAVKTARISDLAAAVEHLSRDRPDVVLLQLDLILGNTHAALDSIAAKASGTPVILFGSELDESEGVDALRWGAVDYLVTNTLDGPAIERVLRHAAARGVHERNVRESVQRYRALFENSPEGIIAFKRDGKVFDVNPAFERLFGFSRSELAGKRVIDVIVPPRHEESARRIMDQTLATGCHVASAFRRRSDGSEIEVSILGAPVELNGEQAGGFGIYRDVTSEREARERLEEAFIDLVETTSRMMESVDPYTAAHQRMVARMGDVVGRKLGLDDDRLQGLYVGALLHDIGKLSLPSTILTKPGKLSPQEWALIRSHPRRGYEVLLDAKLPWPVADMALRHHERLDGSGYPDGVMGESVSLELRILSVCDVVEAMSADRPYRPGLPLATVLSELDAGSGVRYDLDVVNSVVDSIKEGEITLGVGYDSAG
jgi:PAS domain S-box-containing protein